MLQLDAENVDAMAGLAVCELSVAAASASSELRADATKRASKLLARVWSVLTEINTSGGWRCASYAQRGWTKCL